MHAQHLLLCLAFGAAAAVPASLSAQGSGSLVPLGSFQPPWLGHASLGLSIHRNESRAPCNSVAGGCEEMSVVGKASFGEGFGLFGKVGSSYARSYALGSDSGSGLTYGAGISWDLSPRASATLGWESYDLRLGGPALRSTSLGLQLRY